MSEEEERERERRRRRPPLLVILSCIAVMAIDQQVWEIFLAVALGFVALYGIFTRNAHARRRVAAEMAETHATTTTSIDGKCRSKNGAGDDVDVIIVGAGVAGAALAHTLGKVRALLSSPDAQVL